MDEEQVDIRDFPGMATEVDPEDMERGASPLQINCTSEDIGRLQSRPALAPVSFEE